MELGCEDIGIFHLADGSGKGWAGQWGHIGGQVLS